MLLAAQRLTLVGRPELRHGTVGGPPLLQSAGRPRDWDRGRGCGLPEWSRTVLFSPFGVDVGFYRGSPYPEQPHVVTVGGDRDRDPATLSTRSPGCEPDDRTSVRTSSKLLPQTVCARTPAFPTTGLRTAGVRLSGGHRHPAEPARFGRATVGLQTFSSVKPWWLARRRVDDHFTDGRAGRRVPPRDPVAMS